MPVSTIVEHLREMLKSESADLKPLGDWGGDSRADMHAARATRVPAQC
jgi:hypothetical protein